MDIEVLATSAFKKSIAKCDYLDSFISEGDKEPSWDGSVYIHKDKSKSKKGIKKVSVQIKGKSCIDFKKDEISYPIKLVDLDNYLYDGGVIFFVVYVRKRDCETKTYYDTLLPTKIKYYISSAKEKITKSIKLKKFPEDCKKKTNIFLNFFKNREKQFSFAGKEQPSIDELIKRKDLESFIIELHGYELNRTDPIKELLSNEIYVYAEIKGINILQPVKELTSISEVTTEAKKEISVNGKTFYHNCQLIRSKERLAFQFGKGFIMEFDSKTNEIKIHFKPKGKLKDRIIDIEFMLRVLKSKSILFDSSPFPIKINEKEKIERDITTFEKTLEFYKKIHKVLEVLGAKNQLEIDSIKKKEWDNISVLHEALIDKKPISALPEDLKPLIIIKIGDLYLALAATKTEQEGTYRIYDFFKTKIRAYIHDSDNQNNEREVSQFCLLKREHYEKLSNINYDIVVSSLKEIGDFEWANLSLLEMIAAYDHTKDEDLFEAANNIADWLMKSNDNVLPYEYKLLNKYQLIRRKRDFTPVELRKLHALIESGNQREDVFVGTYLLLGNQEAAKMHFEKMDSETQNNFRQFPIFKFWENEVMENEQ
jgi:hypothetical protein